MKTALFFLACIAVAVAQWQPWNPLELCDDPDDCPLPDVYCCLFDKTLGYKKCELTPLEGWACDITGANDCPCVSGLTCTLKPDSTTEATCEVDG